MGLLNKLFGGEKVEKDEKVLPWIPLNDLVQIDYIKKKSSIKTQVIFKHSTRCGISSMVQRQFINDYNFSEKELDLYYLDILSYRNISNEVGYAFQLVHESPQLLVIKNGELVTHASHGQINQVDLNRFV
ncbi:bacillithiol system redox-active protein YtxJ [Jejuia pallidilutea]|uniref:General stress protein n=1 Tax=Jejuia pallidilutea TaxID=504487 RepID=A0A090W4X5_9FLAO|nr:bacillithiol system redox-active protein YtxJ [Jejuia pallidilutea]GAL68541.1 general stress protein [Jejuia pallidilutea]GAL72065.1 general stress protein [Jejuia pallidilutea]GAL88419.1 general stress protein [Jejuia pallidilutea]